MFTNGLAASPNNVRESKDGDPPTLYIPSAVVIAGAALGSLLARTVTGLKAKLAPPATASSAFNTPKRAGAIAPQDK